MHNSTGSDRLPGVEGESPASHQRVTIAYTNQPCRRKLQFINGKFAVQKPQTSTVQKRNERERNRVKLINRTFATLRDRLPPKYSGKKEKKLSKVEVLKTATAYIAYLVRVLEEDDRCRRNIAAAGGSLIPLEPQQPLEQWSYCYSSSSGSTTANDASVASTTVAYHQQSFVCDLTDLLDDSATSGVPTQQTIGDANTEEKDPEDEMNKNGVDDFNESGIFQLSCDSGSSSSMMPEQPQQPHTQLLPMVPPDVNINDFGCFTFSTPIKTPQEDGGCVESPAAPAFFYSTDSSTVMSQHGQEFHILSINDASDHTSFYQFI